jgi:tRNA(Arg) A34 adenosine deaminase TadA
VAALRVEIALPDWLEQRLATPVVVPSRAGRMRMAIDLARENVRRGTGGPFGALVADSRTGEIVSLGVNAVVPTGNCTAHAEMLALQLAEARVGGYDLGAGQGFELVTSVEPCVMCLGAVVWSGVRTLVCGARDEDARAVGFDEGPKPARWVEELGRRGITVVLDLQRASAADVLREYARLGRPVYNPTT